MTGGRWDELRQLLAEGPGELAFRAVCALLDTWPGPDRDEATRIAEERLAEWPDRVRVAPWSWLCALRDGAALPSWPLVRALRNYEERYPHRDVPLRSLGERPEWAVIKRVELDGESDDDLRWLIETESLWPQLQSIKCSFWRGDPATARRLSESPLLPRLRTLSLDTHGALFPITSLARAARLDRLGLSARPGEVRRLLERSRLTNLFTLKLIRSDGGQGESAPEAMARLADAPGVERLRVLELCSLHESEVHALLSRAPLHRLRELILRSAAWAGGPALVEALIDRPFLAPLRRLTLTHHRLGDDGVIRLREALKHTRVEQLELVEVGLGDEAVFTLSACAGLRNVRTLDLSGNEIGSLGAATLAGSPYLTDLQNLHLAGRANAPQPIGDLGVIPLAGRATYAHLRSLTLRHTALTPRGVAALAASRALCGLGHLDLSANPLGREGATRLASAPLLPQLRSLDLSQCALDDDAVRALLTAGLSSLRSLHLCRNALGSAAAEALAGARALRGLWQLDLSGNRLGPEGRAALVRSPVLGGLVERDLGADGE